jgi:DNA-directed RNA polymerase II subunit RPB9
MLYPKEDRANSRLMYACRTCQFSEPASSSCVYRNQLSNTVGETAGVTLDVGSDPTVGSLSCSELEPFCTLCGKLIMDVAQDKQGVEQKQTIMRSSFALIEQFMDETDYDEEQEPVKNT